MAINQSPSVVTNSLVFAYDMSNTQKSWQGRPTINLVSNPNAAINVITDDVPREVRGKNVIGYASYSTDYAVLTLGTTSTAATGKTFTYSLWMRSPGAQSTYLMYVFDGTGGDGGWWNFGSGTLTTQWQRYTGTVSGMTGTVQFIRIYRLNQVGTIQIAAPQFEESTFATPFVNGSRTINNSVLDLTGRRNIGIGGSPTYSVDGSFTFNSAGSTTLNLGTGANFLPMPSLTLEAWIKTPGLGSGMSVNGVWGFTYGIRFNVASNGVVYFIIGTDVTTFVNIATSGVNVNDNNWHHIVAVKNGDASCAIYVDGVVRASGVPVANWSGTNPWFAMEIQVGRDQNDAPYYFNGRIDVGRVYNRGLSAAEVQQNFNALRGRYGI
jgi:hypothetical protein